MCSMMLGNVFSVSTFIKNVLWSLFPVSMMVQSQT